jgi:hypothetical protein
VLDQRGQLLRAALGFAGLPRPSYDRALWALRSWLDSWSGIGHVAAGMHRQGFDLQLTQYDDRGWRATFYTSGMEHSPTSATGTAWERTPWRATQRAEGRDPMTNKRVTFGIPRGVVFEMHMQDGPLPRGLSPPTGNLDATAWITCTEEEARTMAAWLSSRREQNPEYEAATRVINLTLGQREQRR